jgi:hypothetical protein
MAAICPRFGRLQGADYAIDKVKSSTLGVRPSKSS